MNIGDIIFIILFLIIEIIFSLVSCILINSIEKDKRKKFILKFSLLTLSIIIIGASIYILVYIILHI